MPEPATAGRVLGGRYRLDRELARGGMATVWIAEDPLLSRRVAVKLLLPALAVDEALRLRFRNEAIAAAKLTHPGIVATYDTGDDDGTAYIVMELVEGITLRHLIHERGRLPVPEAADIASQVADAIEHAHRQGLVHRDIKPANVLVQPDGRVKVTDFGIAKAAGGDDLTRTGTVVGTARYLAPEQVNGHKVDGRADVYALGLILYEMLAGSAPFAGDSDMATAVARLTNAPEPIRTARPEVSRHLEDVVARSLARDPEYRYQSAREFKDALTPGHDTAPTGPLAPPPPPPPRPSAAHAGGGAAPTAVGAPSPAGPAPLPPRRRGRRWPWLVLILVLLGAGAAVAYALTNTGGGADAPGTAAAASQALPIAAAKDFDPPPGDGSEHPQDVHFAIDGDPATAWQTESYSNRNFGNAKSGVGLWVQLDAAHDVTALTVTTLEDGWSAQIYVADQPGSSLDAWGPARASGDNLPAVRRFDLNARGQYVLIWCTQLPPSDKLQIGDVKVEGR
ncbi:MAG TPA: protein kinase [Acidimicrobiia bacterium]|nr:protein kinase [Acidimicrobiia bacterium]